MESGDSSESRHEEWQRDVESGWADALISAKNVEIRPIESFAVRSAEAVPAEISG